MDIAILLSTYNGEKYLAEQIDSLFQQTYQNFVLHIRDDGSSDSTLRIIEQYQSRYTNVVLHQDNLSNIGCIASFLTLAQSVSADFYFFCDQDDVWQPNKLERAIAQLQEHPQNIPLLYHSDLTVVDSDLTLISPSFLAFQHLSAEHAHQRSTLFMQNFVVGCSSAANRCLIERALKNGIAQHIGMHDWWLALIAKTQGELIFDRQATILYRQHQSNVLGAQKPGVVHYLKAFLSGQGLNRIRQYRQITARQAAAFLANNAIYLDQKTQQDLVLVAQLNKPAAFFAVLRCFYRGLYLQGMTRNFALLYSTLYEIGNDKLDQ